MGKWWFNGILWDLTSGYVKIAIHDGDRQFMSCPFTNSDFCSSLCNKLPEGIMQLTAYQKHEQQTR